MQMLWQMSHFDMKLMDPYWFLSIDLKDGEMKHQCEK